MIVDVKEYGTGDAGSGGAFGGAAGALAKNAGSAAAALNAGVSQFPIEAYYSVSEKTFDGVFTKTFKSINAEFGADEAEDVGTEHLLRDLRNASTSTLATHVEATRGPK